MSPASLARITCLLLVLHPCVARAAPLQGGRGVGGEAKSSREEGLKLYALGRYGEAVESFRRAVRSKPDYPEAYNDLGMALLNAGLTADAFAAFGRAVSLRPDFPEAHYNLGSAYYASGRLEEAADAFKEAVRLRPDY